MYEYQKQICTILTCSKWYTVPITKESKEEKKDKTETNQTIGKEVKSKCYSLL